MSDLVPLSSFQPHASPVLCLSYDVDGEYVLSGGQDKTICLSQPVKGRVIAQYAGHTADVLCLKSTSDHKRIFSSGVEKSVFVWDVSSFRTIRKFHGHESRVNALALFAHTDDVVASGSYDSSVRLWDLRSSQRFAVQILKDAKDSVSCLSIHEQPVLASGSVDGTIRVYDLRRGLLFQDALQVPITDLSYRSDTNVALVSTLDSTLRLVDISSGLVLAQCTGHANGSMKSCHALLHPSDKLVFSGSEDGFIYGWDIEGMSPETDPLPPSSNHTFKSQNLHSMTLALDAHPTLPMFATGSLDGTVRTFDCGKLSKSP